MKKDRVSRLEDVLSRRRRSTTTPVSPSSSLSSSSSSSSHCSTSHSSSRWRNVALLVVLFFAFSSLHLAGILRYFITLYMYIKPLRCFWLSTRINIASYTFTWLLHKRRPTSSCFSPNLGRVLLLLQLLSPKGCPQRVVLQLLDGYCRPTNN